MGGLLETPSAEQRDLLGRARPGAELAARPMPATLSDRRDFPDEWIFERKLDGIRVPAVREGGRVALLSRTGRRLNDTYPEIVDALAAQPCHDFTVDGEIVAFSRGQDIEAGGVAVTYYVFDLLGLDGRDLTRLPLRIRKSLPRRTLGYRSPLRLTPHRNQGGAGLPAASCARGWEGLIAKRADSTHHPRRSTDWLKLTCSQGQEFVIGAFTEPAGTRVGLGALLLGHHQDDGLRYAGKVGAARAPFDGPVREARARWVRPELVAQIAFTEWTRDGMLRHPRFLGLREDKEPREVVRERPAV